MEAFTAHTGTAVPLRKTDIDTDQIIPVRFCATRVTKAGFGEGMMADLRTEPDFVLNQPQYNGATVLVAGENFGVGSSREWAVWAIMDYGFRAVFSTRFGDIFRNNAAANGLVAGTMPQDSITQLWKQVENHPDEPVTVDLEKLEVSVAGMTFGFEYPADFRWRVLNGIDEISLTLQAEDEIAAFEGRRRRSKPAVPLTRDAPMPTPIRLQAGA
ncbi:3-isopropylmalate dehydratase small subunit [Citricoccus sp.]|uniref:3-isopropylmalate dehydratase small subunit n=1 Tax=Citricoccus sp. TaxID=1978372 RepID=UPI0028BE34F3|nr:3-isopropylmalate dehydratase small subunit [Citricoccus sp.]